nr:hypothetical protein [Tanacetum cinerariifolium]
MRNKEAASWDLGKRTWGGRERGFGTVSVLAADLDIMSMDDLYNNLKLYKPEVKGMSSSSSSTQNMAFVSSSNNNTSSINGAVNTTQAVNTAHGVSTASTKDLDQIHPNDMEEMDLRWQMAMLTMRARRQRKGQIMHSWLSHLQVLTHRNFMPPTPDLSFTGLDEFVNKHVVENCKAKSNEEEPKVVRKNDDALIIEQWVSDNEKEDVSQPKIEKKTGNPQMDLQDQGVIDSGCSRYMTGNLSYLTDYEEIDRGYVAFGGNLKGDHLAKFDGKADEGFFVGYFLNSKAVRVFNSRTRIVEENLHISDDGKKVDEDTRKENECNDQEKDYNVNSTNNVNTFDPNMPALEDVSTFDFSSDDEDDGTVVDMNNLDTTIQVSHILTMRIHKDHPLDQVIRGLQSATQTRKMSKNLDEHGFVSTIQQRTNHKDLQNCLFACFLSQEEPKKIKEEVYVCQPIGFKDLDFPGRVYKVEKALRTYILLRITSKAEEGWHILLKGMVKVISKIGGQSFNHPVKVISKIGGQSFNHPVKVISKINVFETPDHTGQSENTHEQEMEVVEIVSGG